MQQPIAIITLDYPLALPEGELTELTMRRPTLRDEIDHVPVSRDPRKQMAEEAAFFAYLCGRKPHELDGLDMSDYEKLQKQYLFFRGKPEDGKGNAVDGGVV